MCAFFVIYIEFFPYCLFVNNSQVIGCEDHLQNDIYCVRLGVKLYSIQKNPLVQCIVKCDPFNMPTVSLSVHSTVQRICSLFVFCLILSFSAFQLCIEAVNSVSLH